MNRHQISPHSKSWELLGPLTAYLAVALAVFLTFAGATQASAAGPIPSDSELAQNVVQSVSDLDDYCPPGFRELVIKNDCSHTVYFGEATATGPNSPVLTCTKDSDCGPNQVCENNMCYFPEIVSGENQACTDNADCKKGQICNTNLGVTGLCQYARHPKHPSAAQKPTRKFRLITGQRKIICVPGTVPDSFSNASPPGHSCKTNSDCQSFNCISGTCGPVITWNTDLWPRTGCRKNKKGVFVCQTGDCGGGDCNYHGGTPPNTLAEMTFQKAPSQDYYDVSQVNGENVGVEMRPITGTFATPPYVANATECTKSSDCALTQTCVGDVCTPAINQCGLCTSDTDCPTTGKGYCSCSATNPCPSPFTCDLTTGLCSGQPYECGSPGKAITGAPAPNLQWPDVATELCSWNAKKTCPAELQDLVKTSTTCGKNNPCTGHNQVCDSGVCQKIVGCYAPNKACADKTSGTGILDCTGNVPFLCATADDCPDNANGSVTMTCDSGECSCGSSSDCPANFQCDANNHCVPSSSAPTSWDTWASLYGCVGGSFYGQSGYTPGVPLKGTVCGCPDWSDDANSKGSAYCNGHNYNWETAMAGNSGPNTGSSVSAQGYAALFKAACPTAYSYAFDDATSTFECIGNKSSPGASYKITFCPEAVAPLARVGGIAVGR